MGATTRMTPIARNFLVQPGSALDPAVGGKIVADFHRAQVAEAVRLDTEVIGSAPPQTTFVNGMLSDDLSKVRPGQAIVTQLDLASDMLQWIWDVLVAAAPRLTGAFQRSITIYADGVQVDDLATVHGVTEVVYTSTAPYARKIEAGESNQAPEGIFEGVAALARRRFGNQADIRFTFRNPVGGETALDKWAGRRAAGARRARQQHQRDTRQPAVIVRFR